jgi:hypothetical protein
MFRRPAAHIIKQDVADQGNCIGLPAGKENGPLARAVPVRRIARIS